MRRLILLLLLLSPAGWAFNPLDPNQRCDYIVLTHDSLSSQAVRLHNFHLNHPTAPLRSCFVLLSEVTSNFAGATVVDKIRNFVLFAYSGWKIAPTYLVLIGDADIQNSTYDLIPSLVRTNEFFDYFGVTDFVDDGYYAESPISGQKKPILHLGRIPARTLTQLSNAIDKILAYDAITGTPTWLGKILMLVGDKDVNATDNEVYKTFSDQLQTEEFSGWPQGNLTTRYAASYPSSGWPANATAATQTLWNSGYGFVNAFGNTSYHYIFVLNADFNLPPDPPPSFTESLTGTNRLPVVFGGSCLVNYFYMDDEFSVGEDLLLSAPNRGAVAVVAPNHVNNILESYDIDKLFVHKMLTDGVRNVGRLFSTAKGLFLSQGLGHEILGQEYTLLGDPALDIKLGPLPHPTSFVDGAEIENPPILQDTLSERSGGIVGDNLRVVHLDGAVSPLLSDRMVRARLTDNPGSPDYLEWKLASVNLPIQRNTILSFWLNVVSSPGGADRIVIDGNTTAGRIRQNFQIFDQNGVLLDAQYRPPMPPGWQFFYADLSPLEGQILLDLRLRYQTTSASESGPLLTYVDEIRVERNMVGGAEQEILNSSIEDDKDGNGTPDFWTNLFGFTATGNARRSTNIPPYDGNFSMLVYDESCNGQGAQQIFHSNIGIPSYTLTLRHRSPSPMSFRVKLINTETNGVIANTLVPAADSWGLLSIPFTNPSQITPGRIKIQIVPELQDCALPLYIDAVALSPPIATDAGGVDLLRPPSFSVSPNPTTARARTTVAFELHRPSKVAMYVYDVDGRRVAYQPPIDFPRGGNKLRWRPSSPYEKLPTGTYFVRLVVDGKPLPGSRKVTILK